VRDVNHPPSSADVKEIVLLYFYSPLRLRALLQDEVEVCHCLCKYSLVFYVGESAKSLFGDQLLLAYFVFVVFCDFEFSSMSFCIDLLVGSDLW